MEIVKSSNQPLLFAAPIWWYSGIELLDTIIISDYDKFPDYPYFNRIEFAGMQGRQSFSIPLVKESRDGCYSKVRISYQTNWHHQLVNALKTAYGKSPFFEFYDYQIEPIIKRQHEYLFELNMEMLLFTLKALKVDTRIKTEVEAKFIEPSSQIVNIPYYQVFEEQNGFIPGLSILDFLFNEGGFKMP